MSLKFPTASRAKAGFFWHPRRWRSCCRCSAWWSALPPVRSSAAGAAYSAAAALDRNRSATAMGFPSQSPVHAPYRGGVVMSNGDKSWRLVGPTSASVEVGARLRLAERPKTTGLTSRGEGGNMRFKCAGIHNSVLLTVYSKSYRPLTRV